MELPELLVEMLQRNICEERGSAIARKAQQLMEKINKIEGDYVLLLYKSLYDLWQAAR